MYRNRFYGEVFGKGSKMKERKVSLHMYPLMKLRIKGG